MPHDSQRPSGRSQQAHPPPTGPWQIVGAGSIGCLFAAYLQRAGIDVQLLLRDRTALALWQREGAITLQRSAATNGGSAVDAERIALPALAVEQLQQPARKILLCTKAQQSRAAIEAMLPAIDANALLVLLQNGMGVREQLAELLPQATIAHALTTEGVFQSARFHLVHAGRGATVIGVPRAYSQRAQLAQAICAQLRCELTIETVENIEERLWLKLIVNSAINPLTALYECRNGELPQLPGIDAVVAALCAEACAVANAEGQRFDTAQLIANVYQVCHITAANRSSMLQDLTQRRLSEIDFINGYILQRAARHGIDCPRHSALFTELKQRERALGCK